MIFRRQNISVYISVLGILVGSIFIAYERFLDGTIINPVDEMRVANAVDPFDSTPYSNPAILGDIIGAYQTRTDKDVYKVGEDIYVILSFCHKRDIIPIMQWNFVDDQITTLVAKPGPRIDKGCHTEMKLWAGKIPHSLALTPNGTFYQLKGSLNYQINPLHRVSYVLLSNNFVIK